MLACALSLPAARAWEKAERSLRHGIRRLRAGRAEKKALDLAVEQEREREREWRRAKEEQWKAEREKEKEQHHPDEITEFIDCV